MCRKIISLCFILLFFALGSCLKAQEYVYPVLTSELWGRDVFAQQEMQESTQDNDGWMDMVDAPSFCSIFSKYEKNLEAFNLYNDSIYIDMPKEEWVQMFKRRARTYADIFKQSNTDLSAVRSYFASDNVSEVAYDSLYYWCNHMLYHGFNDVFLFEDMMSLLIPHYAEVPGDEHLVFCYFLAGVGTYQCSRMGETGLEPKSLEFFRKVLDFTGDFDWFGNPLNRYFVLMAYADIVSLHAQAGTISLEECLELTKKIQAMLDKPRSREILDNDPRLADMAKWAIDLFRFRGITAYISQGLNKPALRNELYGMYCDARNELGLTPSNPFRYYANLQFDDCLVEAYMGKTTWDKALDRFLTLQNADPEMIPQRGEPIINVHYYYNASVCFAELLDKSSLAKDKKRALMKKQIETAFDLLPWLDYRLYPYEIGQILSNVICNEKVFKYLTEAERTDFMFIPFIMEQPTTFVHVSMVADLSRILASAMVENRPGYFVGVPGYGTTKEVKAKKDELVDFIYNAALYHDFGKIMMPTIIGNNYRKITDHEYSIIKLHPEISAQILDTHPKLKNYRDVAIGHHKWYNGRGYPESFNNRQSPYFQIICLVMLCDCMDAATENISRNYHKTKTLEKLMREYDDAAAAQYHQALLKFLNTHPETYQQMKECITEGRYAQYIDLYKNYIGKHFLTTE